MLVVACQTAPALPSSNAVHAQPPRNHPSCMLCPKSTLATRRTGGVLDDALIARQTAAGVRAVFAPKVAGSAALARDLTCTPLSGGAIFFSSAAVLVGSAGQANYAAANAALDALADRMQAAGCPGMQRGYPWGADSV